MHDFTYRSYSRLLDALSDSGRRVCTVKDFLLDPPRSRTAILRHDVEYDVRRSVRTAQMEAERGVFATYYFHGPNRPKVFKPDVMLRLREMGHEVGYHYQTLDLRGGDFDKAIALFEDELSRFRAEGVRVDTVCLHGNPRVKKVGYAKNNEIFLRDKDLLARSGLLGEAYLSLEGVPYRSDTGVRWNPNGTICDLIRQVRSADHPIIYILTHPDYWSGTAARAFALRNAAKAVRALKVNDKISRLRGLVRAVEGGA